MTYHTPRVPLPEELEYLSRYTIDVTEGKVFNKEGKDLGYICGQGYVVITLPQIRFPSLSKNKNIKRSHIIWWKANNKWPERELDHDNRNKLDDRIVNLIPKSHRGNMANKPKESMLPIGVRLHKPSGRYHCYVYIKSDVKYLGSYGTPEEAAQTRLNYLTAHNLS